MAKRTSSSEASSVASTSGLRCGYGHKWCVWTQRAGQGDGLRSTRAARTYGTVCQDLKRWHERGVDGLTDAPATNQPEKLTQEMRKLVVEKLQEDRTWTCRQLVETVEQRFAVAVSVEAMRKRVRELGYCWKRTRYVPCKEINPELEREHRASLETLKRGPKKGA